MIWLTPYLRQPRLSSAPTRGCGFLGGSNKGYPVAKAINQTSFAIVLQQCVDEAFGIDRERSEYLEHGTQLNQALITQQQNNQVTADPAVADTLKQLTEQLSQLAPVIEVAKEYMATRKAISLHHSGLSDILDTMSQPAYQKALPSAEMITTADYLKANNITLDRKAKHCFANEAAFTFRVLAQKEPRKICRKNVYRTSDVSILATALKSTLSKFE